LRIIYLHQYFKFPDESGGTRSYDLASSLIKQGIDITVVTSTSDIKYKTKARWNTIKKEGIEINYVYLPYGNHLTNVKRIVVFFKFLLFSSIRLIKLKADLILATSTPLTIGIPVLIKKWFHNTPFIFEVRDVWPEAVIAIGVIKNKYVKFILFNLEKLIYKNAKTIVPLSTDMQFSIISRYPELEGKTNIVIENISEINRFQKSKIKLDLKENLGFKPRFSILYAGSFGKVNRVDKVIDYAEKIMLYDKGIVFILIGTGSEKKKVIELAQRKNVLNRNVFIFDPIPKSELTLWYNSVSMGSSFVADIQELWANSANKFFDTLAAGKPILINYKGWQSEIISKLNIGYILNYSMSETDIIDFIDYTKQFELIQNQSKNAFKVAEEKFSLKIATDKYLDILKK
jgi:glycosyltransferase involved in cell wall biosynthesis